MRRVLVPSSIVAVATLLLGAVPASADDVAVAAVEVEPAPAPAPEPDRAAHVAPSGMRAAPSASAAGSPVTPGERPASAHAEDRVLVRFRDDASPAQESDALASAGLAALVTTPDGAFVPVGVGDLTAQEAVAALREDPAVAEVQLDHIRTAAFTPDDPGFGDTTHLDLIGLYRAWDRTAGAGTVIAVVDDASRLDHLDLAGAMLPGLDLVPELPRWGEGAHAAPIALVAAARADNGTGIAGVAHGAQVLPIRVLTTSGSQHEVPSGFDSDIAAGIRAAADRGADVINVSLAGWGESPVLLEALWYATSRGAVVVVAAGNAWGAGPSYPAAYAADVPGVLSVGATDSEGWPLSTSAAGDSLSLVAPGDRIRTPGVVPTASGDEVSGTSIAAALVTGTAALVAGLHPSWSAEEIADQVARSARDGGPRGIDPYYGHGVLDVAGAVGLTPAVPFDRTPVDTDGRGDEVPARATSVTMAGGVARAAGVADGEGDVDWFMVPAVPPGSYRPTVTYGTGTGGGLTVRVVDQHGAAPPTSVDAVSGPPYVVTQTQPLWMSVQGRLPHPWSGGYTVRLERTGDVPDAGLVRFGTAAAPSLGACGPVLDLHDVTGDGLTDLVTASERLLGGNPVRVTRMVTLSVGLPGGGFATPRSLDLEIDRPFLSTGRGQVVVDLDGDGGKDILVGTAAGPRRLTAAGGSLVDHGVLVAGLPWTVGLRAGDLESDGDVDVVLLPEDGSSPLVLRQAEDGTFAVTALGEPASGPLELVDLDEDGSLDVLRSGRVRWGMGDGSFAASAPVPALADTDTLVVADVDADGHADVLARRAEDATLLLARGAGDGTLSAPVLLASGFDLGDRLAVADLNADGRADVLHGDGQGVLARLQGSGGTFEWAAFARVDASSSVAAHDVDGDGDADALGCGFDLRWAAQIPYLEPSSASELVWDVSPANHSAGVAVRPIVHVTTRAKLAAGAVTAETVQLIEGATGHAVPAARSLDAKTGVISLVPDRALRSGHHYQLRVAGLVDENGTLQTETVRSWFTVGAGGDRFTPVEPYRVMDTRDGGAPVEPGVPVVLEMGGVEVPVEATAVVLNVTAVAPSGRGNVRVYPTPSNGERPPLVSNLNVVPGEDQPNMVTVRLGKDGTVSFLNDNIRAHLVADIAGYYSPYGATAYVPLQPVRVMDTRDGSGGVPGRPLEAAQQLELTVTGRHGVPDDATAVVLNVTGVGASAATNVRVFPAPEPDFEGWTPTVSSLNLQRGRDQPNLVTVRVGEGGRVRFFSQTADVHLIADLAGYYAPEGDRGFVPIEPTRVIDTRSAQGLPGPLLTSTTASVRMTGSGPVPADADAVVLNVTAVSPQRASNVRVFPTTGTGTVPLVSNLNVSAGRDEPNQVIVRVGVGGAVSYYSQTANLGLVVDVAGYFRR